MKFKINIFVNFILFTFFFFTTDFIATGIFQSKKKYGIKHDKFHHHLKENISISNSFNGQEYIIKTNSLGLRDKEIRNIEYKNFSKRLGLIGDSYTFGVLLNYEDTFAGMIENSLTHVTKGGGRGEVEYNDWEVLNFGVSSYSPIIYYYKIKYFLDKGLKLTNLAVFIDISDIQDEMGYYYDDNLKSVLSIQPPFKPTLFKFKMYIKDNFFVTWNFLAYLNNNIFNFQKFKSQEEHLEFFLFGPDKRGKWTLNHEEYSIGINNSLKYMKLLKLLCDENNIKMHIVVYPWLIQLYYRDLESIHVKIWEKFSQENNIEFINLFPLFIDKSDNNQIAFEKIKKYFIPFDGHFNKEGNKLIADY